MTTDSKEHSKMIIFTCDVCNVKIETFSSAAVWCQQGHKMSPKESRRG